MLDLATMQPGVPEIFVSEQGEGPSAGLRSLFIRLSRCNLHCVWCDTAYTWRFSSALTHRSATVFEREENRVRMDCASVAALCRDHDADRLVLTGGEPLLQGPALAELVAQLRAERAGLHVEIETNGTVAPVAALDAQVDQYNVSPKLAHSGNTPTHALVPERLAAWAGDGRVFFKFVIAKPAQVDAVAVLQATYAIPSSRLYLMAEGTDSETLRARRAWLEPLSMARGWRFTDRLHIHLYGDRRGT